MHPDANKNIRNSHLLSIFVNSHFMANKPLTRSGIDTSICRVLSTIGISTVRDLLNASPLLIMLHTDLSMNEVNGLVKAVSELIFPTPVNAFSYLQERYLRERFISTGVQALDEGLKGGLLLGTITDICGAAGLGKTQFCMSCLVQALTPNTMIDISQHTLPSVIYIDAELKFDPTRIVEIADSLFPQFYSSRYREDAPHLLDQLLSRIKVRSYVHSIRLFYCFQ